MAFLRHFLKDGIVTSEIYHQVSDLLMPALVEQLADVWVKVSARHFMEY